MPKPKKGEKETSYIPRAIKHMVKKEGLTEEQALGKAFGMWRSRKK